MNDNETIIKSKEELDTREKLSIKQILYYQELNIRHTLFHF